MSTLGKEILEGLEEAVAYSQGVNGETRTHKIKAPEQLDVRAIRDKLDMSQRVFADTFGISINSLRNWEQGKRKPSGPIRLLLLVIDKAPDTVRNTLIEFAKEHQGELV